MRYRGQLIIALFALLFCGCEGTTFQSSVPHAPVHVEIDTRGLFVHFMPENLNSYITVNAEGYKENGKFVKPVGGMDAWGYGGVVVYVSLAGYVSYDLACPYCAARGSRVSCEMDGIEAVCPHCGEHYELGSGYALPQTGVSKEALKRLKITPLEGKLLVTE